VASATSLINKNPGLTSWEVSRGRPHIIRKDIGGLGELARAVLTCKIGTVESGVAISTSPHIGGPRFLLN
jgi:hypothetical protein